MDMQHPQMRRQRVTVLGSTGSVGANTLDVLARHPDRFEVFALGAATRVEEMLAQCQRFRPRHAVMASAAHGRALADKIEQHGLKTEVHASAEALEMIAAHESVDCVMAAIVGAAGLASCLAAARAGKRLLLANKEALVVGGELFLQAVAEGGAMLLPDRQRALGHSPSAAAGSQRLACTSGKDHPDRIRRAVSANPARSAA